MEGTSGSSAIGGSRDVMPAPGSAWVQAMSSSFQQQYPVDHIREQICFDIVFPELPCMDHPSPYFMLNVE